MWNSRNVWTDPDNAQYPLAELREGYQVYVATRSKPIAAGTQERYVYDLKSFEASLVYTGCCFGNQKVVALRARADRPSHNLLRPANVRERQPGARQRIRTATTILEVWRKPSAECR
jgi:hypothetical protein